MMTDTPESVTLVPIDRIEVLNSRDRDMKVFEEIVENIRSIGLKKPITVMEREGADGAPAYLLVCGEGRLNAFRLLGESHISLVVTTPCNVVGQHREVIRDDQIVFSIRPGSVRHGARLGASKLFVTKGFTQSYEVLRSETPPSVVSVRTESTRTRFNCGVVRFLQNIEIA